MIHLHFQFVQLTEHLNLDLQFQDTKKYVDTRESLEAFTSINQLLISTLNLSLTLVNGQKCKQKFTSVSPAAF